MAYINLHLGSSANSRERTDLALCAVCAGTMSLLRDTRRRNGHNHTSLPSAPNDTLRRSVRERRSPGLEHASFTRRRAAPLVSAELSIEAGRSRRAESASLASGQDALVRSATARLGGTVRPACWLRTD